MAAIDQVRELLAGGLVIPACPLALNSNRQPDQRRQRALFRYYLSAGAGGVAVGVHTTQFAIHDAKIGLFKPLLELASEEMVKAKSPRVRIAGICGPTKQAVAEAILARNLGFDAGLLSLAAHRESAESQLIAHCRAVAEIIPLFGFYLQPSAGGRVLSYSFWRQFAEIEPVVAIKIAPFNRYQTLDVVRAVAEAGRADIALYTGNDDNIVVDLLTPFGFEYDGKKVVRRIVAWAAGTLGCLDEKSSELHAACRGLVQTGAPFPQSLLSQAAEITDANAAFFDAANGYAGCIPGLHEVLRRQGLLEGA